MNQPTTYEQLIAQKLQELEVPDQANAIWSTIEHHLNIEMPADGGGPGGGSNFNWWIGGGSLCTFLVAAITYLYVVIHNPENKRNINSQPAPIKHHQPLHRQTDTVRQTPPPAWLPAVKPAVVPGTSGAESEQAPSKDTLITIPPPKAAEPLPVQPLQTDTLVPKKKQRGVKGISDADYRLVPASKDSLKRKN
ncbi:hypothetical protein GZH53_01345 [Flavihumibacter sp. R14]|nr:hypothetical protein [Flavihumibacter soli]